MRTWLVLLAVLLPSTLEARTLHGTVYEDTNGDGKPSAGEPGVPLAVVARDTLQFVTTDASGQFTLEVPDDATGILWVRVPDGFVPGPVWTPIDQRAELDLGLRRLRAPHRGPLTFVVAADTHLTGAQPFANDLGRAVDAATALDSPPAFFTILGDITQSNEDAQFELVDASLAGLTVPYIPVPGNHDWYDSGAAWFHHYGPDNYSFDIGGVHFIVWNMMMSLEDVQRFLGAELARVSPSMTVVALTHAPPIPPIVAALRRLGVDYVLTAHTHTNRVVDHDGLVELTTEPLLMGGLDFTPAGYRVITIDHGQLAIAHHTIVDEPQLAITWPARDRCAAPAGDVIVAAELDAGAARITARIDCATPIDLAYTGGWTWRATLPALAIGAHELVVEARSSSGARATTRTGFDICPAVDEIAPTRARWPQLGGNPAHTGAAPAPITPPLAVRWTQTLGGHALQAAPAIADGVVFATATDLAAGSAGGIVALELATGAVRWRFATTSPVRGGPAVIGDTVAIAQLDGTLLGLDARTGAIRWRDELGVGFAPEASHLFAAPTVDGIDVLAGHQRQLVAVDRDTGHVRWSVDPVPDGENTQSLASVATAEGIVVGVFHRALGGVAAWDRVTGTLLWRLEGEQALAVNATPVIADGTVYVVNGLTEVLALDALTGELRWQVKLDDAGFDWGNAAIGTPAIARGTLVVPLLYGDLVALDAATGVERWRVPAMPSPLRTTHYRGAREAGFEASPVITGDIVWAADTSGRLTAIALDTGTPLWSTDLGMPVLGALAVAGDWLVVTTFDGTVRALGPPDHPPRLAAPSCAVRIARGCCDAGDDGTPWPAVVLAIGYACARRRRRRTTKPSTPTTGNPPSGPPALHR
ncbi:MAG TPA: PQQ-binding-like beta-propeller repeat protein [Kofleriaceae bacterium]|nr:PQQ-binding-like beta-propeller repeat protein [Kofleriaceae bacterium]